MAEELHFGRAAERLNMTQPPLSRQIQKLEKSVGVQLVERDNRRVALTLAGEAFLDEARKLMVTADRAPQTARRIARGQAGVLRIGFTAVSGFSVLGTLLADVAAAAPDVEVDLREMVTSEQIDALATDEIDVGLARPPFDSDQFACRLLHAEPLELAVPADHPLTRLQRPVTSDDLAETPLIMHAPTKARYFYDLAIRHVPVHHGNVVHTVSQILSMLCLVAAGRGVAFVPASSRTLRIEGVEHLPLAAMRDDVVELHLVWSRTRVNPALRRLLHHLDRDAADT